MIKLEQFLSSGALIAKDENTFFLGQGPFVLQKKEPQEGFYFPDFFLKDQACWFLFKEMFFCEAKALKKELLLNLKTPSLHHFCVEDWQEAKFNEYQQEFQLLKEKMDRNELQKGVLYTFQLAKYDFTPLTLGVLIQRMLDYALKNQLWMYGFWKISSNKEGYGMLGATPEILFSIQDLQKKQLQTVACAGSGLNSASVDQSEKLKEEHDWVIKGIFEALNPFGKGGKAKTKASSFGALTHLVTPIQFNLKKPLSFEEIVLALHPTAALGAYPKSLAMPWLLSVDQKLPRGRFGAPAGYVHKEGERCLVAIRSLQWKEDLVKICAGGGIIKQSVLEEEWSELTWKLQSIKASITN